MQFILDPKKFSDYIPTGDVDGSEIIPIVKDGENTTATIETIRGPAPEDLADLNFEQSFTNTAVVTVTHGLNKKPSVTVVNSAGDEVEGDIEYIDNNTVTVTFSSSFTGVILCN